MRVWRMLVSGLLAVSPQAFALEIEPRPIGRFVRTGPGPLSLLLRAEPHETSSTLQISLQDSAGRTISESRVSLAPGQRETSVSMVLPRYGVFTAQARRTPAPALAPADSPDEAVVTLAAIPNNSRRELATTSPFAMGCYFAMRFTPEELAAGLRLASQAGVAFSREELRWDICEPSRGVFDWDKFDRAISGCLGNHIGVLGLLDYWGAYHEERGNFSPQAVADFCAYTERTVQRYAPGGALALSGKSHSDRGITDWEVWNEPATFWFFSPANFGTLTAQAAQAAHRVGGRNCRVFFANAAEGFDASALQAMNGRPFNGVTPHFYCPPRSPKEAGLASMLQRQVEFFHQRDIRVPLWISEMGWHSDSHPQRQAAQAAYLVQSYVLALAAGYEKVFWYNFVCDTPDKMVSEYGILNRADFSPKRAYAAFAGMVRMLEGKRFERELKLGHNVSCHLFRGEQEDRTAVLWADAGEGELHLREREAGVRCFDDFSNQLELSGSSATLPLRRTPHYVSGGADLARLLQTAKLTGIPQAELTLKKPSAPLKAGSSLAVMLENFSASPARGTLRAEGGRTRLAQSPPFLLEPDSSSTVTLTVEDIQLGPENRDTLQLELELEKGERLTKTAFISEPVAVRGAPTLDGNLDDWANARPLHLDSAAQSVGIQPYMDWNVSGRYWFMWDDENLYFAAKVRDNVHSNTFRGEAIWEGDSWQLGLKASSDGVSGRGDDAPGLYCYGFALTPEGPEAVVWEGQQRAQGVVPQAAIRRGRIPGHHLSPGGPDQVEEITYEVRIPKALVSPAALRAGTRLGYSVLLNDNDGGGRAGWLESSPAIGTGFNPSAFDELLLE